MPMKRRFVLSVVLLFSVGIGIGLASTKLGFDRIFRGRSVAANELASSGEGQLDITSSGQPALEEYASESDAVDTSPPTAEATAIVASASEMVEISIRRRLISSLWDGFIFE
ncbi:MAG: hypothetical protein JXB38_17395 [Anaerolineales bacterium]|nr:hypothetical protein [Anaerolineales bacterium]